MSDPVKITILGTEYSLRTNDEGLLSELASEIDGELKSLQQKFPTQAPAKLAVLTALNVAEKIAHNQQNELRELDHIREEIDTVTDDLEKLLRP
jgi:cell division protein ZapA (FtsZ GTPase activity inhibitor)